MESLKCRSKGRTKKGLNRCQTSLCIDFIKHREGACAQPVELMTGKGHDKGEHSTQQDGSAGKVPGSYHTKLGLIIKLLAIC